MKNNDFERAEIGKLLQRLREPVRRLTIIAGPRQVGKTTLVQQALTRIGAEKPARFIATDQPVTPRPNPRASAGEIVDDLIVADAAWLTRVWQAARATAQDSEKGYVLVLDEIQKIPRWSEIVKGLWDADRAEGLNMHVVLLGSSPLLVQRGLSESLTGRYDLIRLGHWSFREMQEAFNLSLEEFIYFGGYPGSADRIRSESEWRHYVRYSLIEPSIERDVFALNRVNKKFLLKQLFRLGCDYSGQVFTYSKMAENLRDSGDKAHTNTIADYLELLAQAGLLAGLQMFSANRLRLRASPPKLNVLNTALMSVETGYGFAEARADRSHWGRLTESAVGAHLYNTGMADDCRLYYWRKSPHEVDFVLARGRRVLAIEVKSGRPPNHSRGLDAFVAAYPGSKTLVVGEGGVSLSEFLSQAAAHWLE